jgi:hypothetical protein
MVQEAEALLNLVGAAGENREYLLDHLIHY